MKIYCFGNEFVECDSAVKNISSTLTIRGVTFVDCLSPEELPIESEELVILDVCKGITAPVMITDVDCLKSLRSISTHDLDLGFYLKLLKQTGTLQKVKILAVPLDAKPDEVEAMIYKLIENLT